MAFIVKKKISGKEYFYLNENKRIDGKVKTKTIAYLGKVRKDAEKKAEEILRERENKKQVKVKPQGHKISNKGSEKKEISIEELASFCKRKGFVYPSGDIYGGFAGFWDFGPLGVELKNNIKKEWWKFHVMQREDVVGIDGSIITNPKVWEASGHVESFVDYIVKNKKSGEVIKVDAHELEKYKKSKDFIVEGSFNPMFTTNVGPDPTKSSKAYLRPETAQLIFTNFKSVYENSRLKLPFGIAQIGKAFRNEIAPRDFIFRSREFEQMEIEYFIKPNQECSYKIIDEKILVYSAEDQKKNSDAEGVLMNIKKAFEKGIIKKKWHAYWLSVEISWFKSLGANLERFRIRQHLSEELSHYSTDTWDIEYKFPFGWKELQGIADRGSYDLSQHQTNSKKDLQIFDQESKTKFLPHVICEPSLGVERAFLVFMFDSYFQDKEKENIILKLNPKLSPFKAAVFPIIKDEKFEKFAKKIFDDLAEEFNVAYDKSGSIGRRYARQDEAGTPYCITIDEDSLKNKDVTIRDRDTKKQIRVKTSELVNVLRNLIVNGKGFFSFGKELK